MNIADVLGAPVHDHASAELPGSPACNTPPVDTPPPEPTVRSWKGIAVVSVAAALVIGGVSGWLAASMRPADMAATASSPPIMSVPADVAGIAEMFTNLYLTGTASTAELSPIYTGDTPAASATWINSSRTVSGEMMDEDLWSVTVLVDSLEAVDGEYEPVALRYFLIPISTASGRPVATAAPAHIPPPAATAGSDAFTAPVAVDQATAATTFVELYLTGGDDITRYLSATARVPMFATAPYVSAVAAAKGADNQDRVGVTVTATNQRGVAHNLEYTLTLTFDAGVWEVAALGDGTP